MLTYEKKMEIINHIKESMELLIPDASTNEQNYYLRGVIDTLSSI